MVGFKRSRHLVLEAVKKPPLNMQRPPSVQYQRAESKAIALKDWEQQFYENPRQSQAYNSALTTPPDGRAHLILRIASTGVKIKGQVYSQRVSRGTQSTLIRLITGHAFTGAYRLKFKHRNLPPATEEEIACACGAVPEDTVSTSSSTAHSHTNSAYVTCPTTGCLTHFGNCSTARSGAEACYDS